MAPQRIDLDELRANILAGEEVRLLLTYRQWIDKQGNISWKPQGELYCLTRHGQWRSKPEITLMANPANGPEDMASVVQSYANWLADGREATN